MSGTVPVLFANEAELLALYGTDLETAMKQVQDEVELACVTLGPRGSVLVTPDDRIVVAAEPVDRVVDTTGAGDQFAAGFLHGLTQGRDLASCGRLGSLAAAEIISHYGARPETSLAELARAKGL